MIKVDNLYEYVTLMNLKKYCENKLTYDECGSCMMRGACDLFPAIPSSFEITLEMKGEVENESDV